MREIKFRVWDPNTESIYNNVGIDKIHLYDFKGDNITEQDALVIMQYTGLKDRNGKEIYEGDIFHSIIAGDIYFDVVDWSDIDAAWKFESIQGHCNVLANDIDPKNGEVIGNIYENPELLERSE